MSDILPQQRLLLELIIMSGDIAVPSDDNGTVLFRTIQECEQKSWLTLHAVGAGFARATVTKSGRSVAKPD